MTRAGGVEGDEGGRSGSGAPSPHAGPPASGVEIRPLRTRAELAAAVALQRATWGEHFSELVPASMLELTQWVGGVAAGAFAGEELLGFVFGLAGIEAGEPIHWSDMLAVRAGARDRRIGEALKRWQREAVLRLGVRRMYWSFDPLESKNAYFNLMRLGAVAREYRRDMYGASDSPLHQGIGTDRLIALWLLDSERVVRRLAGEATSASGAEAAAAPLVNPVGWRAGLPVPEAPNLALDAPFLRIAIPGDVQALKQADPALAQEWRATTREAFEAYLKRGFTAEELLREDGWSAYLMVRHAGGN